ncbi:MAG: amino acid ABC transporter permease [Clostridiales bacterium]|jgi:polar amino acid transport system permease protein|nr:amino acid ABC transporter permease [Clostridiales bacterium]
MENVLAFKTLSARKQWIKTGAIVLAAIAVCAVFGFLKPSRASLAEHVSTDLIQEAGSQYSETYFNYVVFNILRGKNLMTAVSDTYIGFLRGIHPVNSGFAATAANMIIWLPPLVNSAKVTVSLSVATVIAGVLLSIFLALGKISKNKFLQKICGAYIFFFRGTPLLMQLFFIYYGLPQISPSLAINNKFLAAFIAFSLNSAAYCAEIIRAAIQSIDKGQFEASRVLGMSYAQTMRLIVIPQSIRRLIPPVANEFIMLLKDASLVSIIALSDLTHMTRAISSASSTVLVYIPAMIIYLIITAFFSFIFARLERRFSLYQ